jgi:hypothetical protein
VSWVFGALAVTLGIVFLWGLFAPRSQWRTLSAWTVSHPDANEPGGAAYAWRRFICGVGIVALLAVAGAPWLASMVNQPRPGVTPTAIEQMWGSPAPHFVDRIIDGLTAAPIGLVDAPILGVQDFDDGLPLYVRLLPSFSILGDADLPGYVGAQASPGFSAEGSASLVVNVRGPLLCIPRQVVVIESETAVQIGVYYGLPDQPSGVTPDHVAGCPAAGVVTSSVLVPVSLTTPLGDRVVQDLLGAPVPVVDLIE